MRRFVMAAALWAAAVLGGCSAPSEPPRHPAWSYNSVVYEMNVRQSTPEGTFAAAAERLPHLRDMGVDIVWLMPIHPIGVEGRKGTLGSYYAIADYYGINPEFGTMEDFMRFLDRAHDLGMRVILDYVANHTSPDAAWVTEKPADWYVRDSLGRTIVQYDWTDIAKLNYENLDLRDEMKRVLRFWVERGVDGFRCDAAKEMPDEFWSEAFAELRGLNPDLYLLAEGEGANFHADGFDATYAWRLHHLMNDVAQGKATAADLAAYVAEDAAEMPADAFRLMFTSNHDENSWAGSEFERMGDAVQAMTMLTYTLPNGQPLIYTGQEIGLDRRLAFFEKDPITDWTPNAFTELYTRLNALRHDNAALAAGERGGRVTMLESDVPERVLAFARETGGNRVLVVANLSDAPVAARVELDGRVGSYTDFATGAETRVESPLQLDKWTCKIFIR